MDAKKLQMLIGKMKSFLNEAESLVGDKGVAVESAHNDEPMESSMDMKEDMKAVIEPDSANKKALIIAMMKKKGMA